MEKTLLKQKRSDTNFSLSS